MVLTYHLLVKFSTPHEDDKMQKNQLLARQCYSASLQTLPLETLSLETLDSWDKGKILRAKATKELLSIAPDDQSSEKQVKVSSRLNPQDVDKLTKALRQNVDVFAWFAADMPWISSEMIAHQLNIFLNCHLVRQKRR